MRRALLLVVLLAPALARAQVSGQILFNNGRAFPNYINAAECAGATIDVTWTVALINNATGFPFRGAYALYTSNQVPPGASNPLAPCFTSDSTTGNGQKAFQSGSNNTAAGLTADVVLSGSQIVSNGTDIIADCNSTADQTIYLCVVGTDTTGTPFGFATASVIVSISKPPPPVIGSATPGDGALNVSWGPGTATTVAPAAVQEYSLEATPVDTTVGTPPPTHRASSSPFRYGGLQNGVVYSVRVAALSIADNPSDPSDAVTGMPEAVRDFWDQYKADGGRESGGCSAGFAGPVGLGVLLATLALVRRRK